MTATDANAIGSDGAPLSGRLVEFVRMLRGEGFRVGVQEGLDALRASVRTGVLDQRRLRWCLRSLLCSDRDEWRRFDRLFDAYWRPANRRSWVQSCAGAPLQRGSAGARSPGAAGEEAETDRAHEGDDEDAGSGGARGGASYKESLARSDFRFLTDERQMQAVERMVERLARRMRRRLMRRRRIARQGQRIHLRRTIRHSLQYGGMPLELVFQSRRRRLPRLVLLLDVSRSMSLYSLLFLRFARGIVGVFADAQAFAFHTRLVPVTDALRERDLQRLREKLAVISLGWSGGTRIGECIEHFNRAHAPRILNSRSVVVVMSDGFDTGPPEMLADQLRRLRRRARRIIWLNPLLGREGYEPRARAMEAALPLVDVFASAHNVESLLALESELAKI
ncbi:MAG: VWA domain-containing protein [Gammaproteobacteria bacterium]